MPPSHPTPATCATLATPATPATLATPATSATQPPPAAPSLAVVDASEGEGGGRDTRHPPGSSADEKGSSERAALAYQSGTLKEEHV